MIGGQDKKSLTQLQSTCDVVAGGVVLAVALLGAVLAVGTRGTRGIAEDPAPAG